LFGGQQSYTYAKRGAWAGIVVTFLLAVGLGIVGMLGRSAALLAAAADSLADTLSSTAILVGLTIAAAAPDRQHPYGHGKAEPVAGKAVAIVLIIIALGVLWRSLVDLVQHAVRPPPEVYTLYAAVAAGVVHELLFRYQYRVGTRVGSVSLQVDAWNHRMDVLSNLVAVVGVAGSRLGGPGWSWLDNVAGAAIAFVILYVGVKLFRQAAMELMDTRLPEDQMLEIRRVIENVEGVLDVELIRARKSGLVIFLDVHIEVDRFLSVEEGHRIASLVRHRVRDELPQVADVLVHVEPHYSRQKRLQKTSRY